MRTLASCLLLACLGGLCGCPVPQGQSPYGYHLCTDKNTGSRYYLYVPHRYNRNSPAPLLVSCHGTIPYDTANDHVREWNLLAEEYGFIVICPVLTSTDGLFGDGPTPALLSDERRILGAVNQVTYLYNIDRHNIMITGFSGGGFPTYFVGLRHPDIFSAIAGRNCNFNRNSLEGWYPTEALETGIIVYWGDKDPATISGQSENALEYFRSAGFQVETTIVPNAGHERHPEVAMQFWLKHWNGRQPTKATVNNIHKTLGRDLD